MQIEARGGDDDFAFAAEKLEFAGGLCTCQIAGCQPLVRAGMQSAAGPCGGGDGSAANQNLAIGTELDFPARERLADGSLRDVERMVERDEGGSFRHAVALDEDEADCIPEFFQRAGKRSAAADDGPELEAE